jgi:hypothetical protein
VNIHVAKIPLTLTIEEYDSRQHARKKIACDLLLAACVKHHIDQLRIVTKTVELEPPPPPDPVVTTPSQQRREQANIYNHRPTCKLIIAETCRYFNIEAAEMASPQRNWRVSRPRQIAMYLAKKLTQLSLQDIGLRFGGFDHTTVMNAVERTEQRMTDDDDVKRDVQAIRERVLEVVGVASVQPEQEQAPCNSPPTTAQ